MRMRASAGPPMAELVVQEERYAATTGSHCLTRDGAELLLRKIMLLGNSR